MTLFWSAQNTGDGTSYTASASAEAAARNATDSARQLDDRLDQLLLVCCAMWQLLREKTSLTEEDLINRVAQLDAQDGIADGKLSQTPKKCPKCSRTVAAKHNRCLYCGFQLPIDNVFKTI